MRLTTAKQQQQQQKLGQKLVPKNAACGAAGPDHVDFMPWTV